MPVVDDEAGFLHRLRSSLAIDSEVSARLRTPERSKGAGACGPDTGRGAGGPPATASGDPTAAVVALRREAGVAGGEGLDHQSSGGVVPFGFQSSIPTALVLHWPESVGPGEASLSEH